MASARLVCWDRPRCASVPLCLPKLRGPLHACNGAMRTSFSLACPFEPCPSRGMAPARTPLAVFVESDAALLVFVLAGCAASSELAGIHRRGLGRHCCACGPPRTACATSRGRRHCSSRSSGRSELLLSPRYFGGGADAQRPRHIGEVLGLANRSSSPGAGRCPPHIRTTAHTLRNRRCPLAPLPCALTTNPIRVIFHDRSAGACAGPPQERRPHLLWGPRSGPPFRRAAGCGHGAGGARVRRERRAAGGAVPAASCGQRRPGARCFLRLWRRARGGPRSQPATPPAGEASSAHAGGGGRTGAVGSPALLRSRPPPALPAPSSSNAGETTGRVERAGAPQRIRGQGRQGGCGPRPRLCAAAERARPQSGRALAAAPCTWSRPRPFPPLLPRRGAGGGTPALLVSRLRPADEFDLLPAPLLSALLLDGSGDPAPVQTPPRAPRAQAAAGLVAALAAEAGGAGARLRLALARGPPRRSPPLAGGRRGGRTRRRPAASARARRVVGRVGGLVHAGGGGRAGGVSEGWRWSPERVCCALHSRIRLVALPSPPCAPPALRERARGAAHAAALLRGEATLRGPAQLGASPGADALAGGGRQCPARGCAAPGAPRARLR